MDISFYSIRNDPIQKTLPKLVEKIYDLKLNIHILCQDDDQLKILDAGLWTYSSLAFLPHGTIHDPEFMHGQNPIWLSTSLDFKNKPSVLVLLTPLKLSKDYIFEKVIYMFDQHQENVDAFLNIFNDLKKENKNPTFWQQTEKGTWQK
ncbi:MAG: DNA polymerase III subunit chi [Proteobacteria bacterium]|nr:DNA polymerase III subunit chi [Pseudomonadota bacterium]